MKLKVLCGGWLLILLSAQVSWSGELGNLDAEIQDIKQQTLELNRDLFILEEELLFPANSQLAVFLSVDIGEYFALDAVKLSVDGEVVSHYLYTSRQLNALQRGGVHRLYIGNLARSSPLNSTCPPFGMIIPIVMRKLVVLPAPFRPSRPTISPWRIA